MADINSDKEVISFSDSDLDLGITDTNQIQVGQLDNFLEGDESTAITDPEDLEPIDNELDEPGDDDTPPGPPSKKDPKAAPKKAAPKNPKVDQQQAVNNFFNEDEDEDEDTPPAPEKKGTPKKNPKTEEGDDTPEDDDTPPEEGTLESVLGDLSSELYNLGIFTTDSEDEEPEVITDPQKFAEKFEVEKRKGALQALNNIVGKYGPEYRQAFQDIFIKGANPKEYLQKFEQVQYFKDMDLTKEKNQELVITEALKMQGWEEEEIADELKKLKDYGDLESSAKRYHRGVVKREEGEKAKIAEQSAAIERAKEVADQQWDQALRQILTDKLKDKDFDGIPVTQQVAENAYDYLYNKKWEVPKTGELLTDFEKMLVDLKKPENYEKRVKVALLMMNDLDLSKVQKKAVSQEKNALFSKLAKQNKQTKNTPSVIKHKSFFD